MLQRSRRQVLGTIDRQPVLDEEMQNRAEQEQGRGVAIEPVLEPPPPGQGEVFVDREGVDVAEAAVLEIARGGVVNRVGPLPVVVGRQREDAEQRAGDVRRGRGAEERAVPAVVLDDEEPHLHEGGRNGQGECEPVGDSKAQVHQDPDPHEQGTPVLASCQMLRFRSGPLCGASRALQRRRGLGGLDRAGLEHGALPGWIRRRDRRSGRVPFGLLSSGRSSRSRTTNLPICPARVKGGPDSWGRG